jgi:hypothetical protein
MPEPILLGPKSPLSPEEQYRQMVRMVRKGRMPSPRDLIPTLIRAGKGMKDFAGDCGQAIHTATCTRVG